jgi:hypothetical protein
MYYIKDKIKHLFYRLIAYQSNERLSAYELFSVRTIKVFFFYAKTIKVIKLINFLKDKLLKEFEFNFIS